jgi:hypothetical protein
MKKTIWDKRIKLDDIPGHIWSITDRDEVIETLFNENRVILGGDILKLINGEYTHDGSSWYYDGESCEESVKKAKEYFACWNPSDDMAVIFVFKPNSK